MKKTVLALIGLAVGLLLVSAACGGGGDKKEPTATAPEATATQAAPADETPSNGTVGDIAFDAVSATITVDGDNADWADVEGVSVPLKQIEIPAGVDWDEPGPLPDINVNLKVATDADNIYVLLEVPDDYNFNPDPAMHNFSASLAVMFRVDDPAGPHMGTSAEDLEASLGMVDLWHWELDCAAGAPSGGGAAGSGDDPDCNLDDEYATDPEAREDDGGGDVPNATAENSLAGVWQHTASSQGPDAAGTWIFEMSRPLATGDAQDAQFASGGKAFMALAYFDPDESLEGWTDTGHLQSADAGWIEVTLP